MEFNRRRSSSVLSDKEEEAVLFTEQALQDEAPPKGAPPAWGPFKAEPAGPPPPLLPPFSASPSVLRARPGFFLPAKALAPAREYMRDYWNAVAAKTQKQLTGGPSVGPSCWRCAYCGFEDQKALAAAQEGPLRGPPEKEGVPLIILQQHEQGEAQEQLHSVAITEAQSANPAFQENGVWLYGTCRRCLAKGYFSTHCPNSGWRGPPGAPLGYPQVDLYAAKEIAAAAAQGNMLAAAAAAKCFAREDVVALKAAALVSPCNRQQGAPRGASQPEAVRRRAHRRYGYGWQGDLFEEASGRVKRTDKHRFLRTSRTRRHRSSSPLSAADGCSGPSYLGASREGCDTVDSGSDPLIRSLEKLDEGAMRQILVRLLDCRRLETRIEAELHQLALLEALLLQEEGIDAAAAHVFGRYGGPRGAPLSAYLAPPRQAALSKGPRSGEEKPGEEKQEAPTTASGEAPPDAASSSKKGGPSPASQEAVRPLSPSQGPEAACSSKKGGPSPADQKAALPLRASLGPLPAAIPKKKFLPLSAVAASVKKIGPHSAKSAT
ncbi:hypothetical protein Efla_004399 [Eimeria flavescens]